MDLYFQVVEKSGKFALNLLSEGIARHENVGMKILLKELHGVGEKKSRIST